MKKKVSKIIAVYIALNILLQTFAPTVAVALTGGPSTPEVESFEPVGTTDLVTPFSGDFNYNIPLMTVPGPNGGYPINLAYHAGITMEQEASWVGLGWNINPGVINRQMRGLPDDLNGESVEKEFNLRPNWTAALDVRSVETELLGFKTSTLSYQPHYNNYKGLGYSVSLSLVNKDQDLNKHPFAPSLDLSFGSDGGLGVKPSLSYHKVKGDKDNIFSIGAKIGSREGVYGFTFGHTRKLVQEKSDAGDRTGKTTAEIEDKGNGGSGVSFSGSSFVPNVSSEMAGTIIHAKYKTGTASGFFHSKIAAVGGSFNSQWVRDQQHAYPAYGYMYEENSVSKANSDEDFLMDYNREKDIPVTKDAPALPMPMHTYDVYSASGQGFGSVFRPFRSDVGRLSDPRNRSYSSGGNLSFETGAVTGVKLGVDAGVNFSRSYSGKWRNPTHYASIGSLNFKGKDDVADPLYEPFYFRTAGELTAENGELGDLQGEAPARFNIEHIFGNDGFPGGEFTMKTRLDGNGLVTYEGETPLNANDAAVRSERERRVANIKYRTNYEIHNAQEYSNRTSNLYEPNEFPARHTAMAAYDYPYGAKQIGEIETVNPDGNKYIYGLPVYNTKQKEVIFSYVANKGNPYANMAVRTFTSYATGTDNSIQNGQGDDHFYSSNSIPPYAYSYLLTAIVSPDYVDLKGDGLTDDDLGYYVKFNYSPARGSECGNTYKWRSPYTGATYLKGNISDSEDDKLSYTYGEKEIYYLNSIETKTHIAIFHLNQANEGCYSTTPYERRDGFGVTGEDYLTPNFTYGTNNSILRYLEKIELHSKSDDYAGRNSIPISTVNFEYSYELCGNTENNNADQTTLSQHGNTAENPNAKKGKLTLKKLWFSYLGNKKGQLSPYQFFYTTNPANTDQNPDYSLRHMDRWGNYKPELSSKYTNEDDPYVNQRADYDGNGVIADIDQIRRNDQVSAWNLRQIVLPSGGIIKVEYEADDYAHVQNKVAQQMFKVVGTYDKSFESGNLIPSSSFTNKITGKYVYVFFELERPISSSSPDKTSIIKNHLDGIQNMYFKVFTRLKQAQKYSSPNPQAYDYVTGYSEIDRQDPDDFCGYAKAETTGDLAGYHKYGFVKVKKVLVNDSPTLPGGDETHPFRKAGWQYMRMERPDLFEKPVIPGATVYNAVTGVLRLVNSSLQLLLRYYTHCAARGFCNKLQLNSSESVYKPSFIRLNSPDKIKYGGGHRVKKITVNDNWASMTPGVSSFDYGQEFTYRMPDGTSSGVAEYEPLIGGDEIALRNPVRYSSDKFLSNSKDLFLEEPYGESLYPGANVGYRKVIVSSLKRKDYSDNQINYATATGYTVYDFYTAKDFPVTTNYTDVESKRLTLPIKIPYVGDISFASRGYSQGYTVELNDMHGKMKAMSVYTEGASLFNPSSSAYVNTKPITKMEYLYHTDKPFSEDISNSLNNEVEVLDGDGDSRTAVLGRTYDFFYDMRENHNYSAGLAGQFNFDAQGALLSANFLPENNYAESMFRSIVTNKVIQKCGIIESVKSFNDGALVITKNLMYDANTGTPLLTQVTNEFNKPVYNYSMPAYWAYDNMGPAYKNTGAYFAGINIASGIYLYGSGVEKYFTVGDQVEIRPSSGSWVNAWVTSIDNGLGSITLKEEDGSSPSFTGATLVVRKSGYNNQQNVTSGTLVSLDNPIDDRTPFDLFVKFNAQVYGAGSFPGTITNYTPCSPAGSSPQTVTLNYLSLIKTLTFTNSIGTASFKLPSSLSAGDLNSITLKKSGNKVLVTKGASTYVCLWNDPNMSFPECMDHVLQAGSVKFTDSWTYNYSDVGNPSAQVIGGSPVSLATAAAANPLRFGKQNIWRVQRSNTFLTDRNASPTVGTGSDISKDGTFKSFVFYNWTDAVALSANPQWTYVSEATRYSPYGFALEEKDATGIFASELYGYDNSLVTASAKNASYFETAFDGFEDYGAVSPTYTSGHGHIDLFTTGSSRPTLINDAHTGNYSVPVPLTFTAGINQTTPDFFNPQGNKKYVVSAWFKTASNVLPEILISGATVDKTTIDVNKIEGWRRIEVEFTAGSSGSVAFTFQFEDNCCDGLMDDLRIMPFKSAITTYVYDPRTLWYVAELDNRNFATFYNRDEEGKLVQVKKETERGIMTIRTTRDNSKRRTIESPNTATHIDDSFPPIE